MSQAAKQRWRDNKGTAGSLAGLAIGRKQTHIPSAATRALWSKQRTGRKASPETRRKQSIALSLHWKRKNSDGTTRTEEDILTSKHNR